MEECLQQRLTQAIKVAIMAGAYLSERYNQRETIIEYKGEGFDVGNIVTIADRESEDIILQNIRRYFPDITIASS